MEILLVIIMILTVVSALLKLTYLPACGRPFVGVICAISVWMSRELAAGQSKTQIDNRLQNPKMMLDVSVLLTIDVALQIAFCILSAKVISHEKLSMVENISRLLTLWMPGILIFPVLFALLVEVIFSFPGMDFATTAWGLALFVLFAFIGLPYLFKFIIPETDIRLELLFILNAMIALLGILATVNGRTAVEGTDSIEWAPLITVATVLSVGIIAGFLIFKRNNNKKIKISNECNF